MDELMLLRISFALAGLTQHFPSWSAPIWFVLNWISISFSKPYRNIKSLNNHNSIIMVSLYRLNIFLQMGEMSPQSQKVQINHPSAAFYSPLFEQRRTKATGRIMFSNFLDNPERQI